MEFDKLNLTDEYGHRLYVEKLNYYLKLTTESKPRLIAKKITGKNEFFTTRVYSKHYMRIMGGYGFCDKFIQEMPDNSYLTIKDEDGKYRIPIADIKNNLKYGKKVHEGFEKQAFMDMDFIKSFK